MIRIFSETSYTAIDGFYQPGAIGRLEDAVNRFIANLRKKEIPYTVLTNNSSHGHGNRSYLVIVVEWEDLK